MVDSCSFTYSSYPRRGIYAHRFSVSCLLCKTLHNKHNNLHAVIVLWTNYLLSFGKIFGKLCSGLLIYKSKRESLPKMSMDGVKTFSVQLQEIREIQELREHQPLQQQEQQQEIQ